MSKKGSLSVALQEVTGRGQPAKSVAEAPKSAAASHRTPAREGKKMIGGYFDPAASKQLRKLALERDSDVQAMLGEALNDLFEKHGLSRIA